MLRLTSVAVYERLEDGGFRKKDSAQKPGSILFPNNDLIDFEQNILPQLHGNLIEKTVRLFGNAKNHSRRSHRDR